jgi:hypothetical protein
MKKIWFFTGFLFFAISGLNAATIGYWRFENNLLDSSGNGHTATGGAGFGYSSNLPGSVIDPGNLSNTASYQQGTAATTVASSLEISNTFSFGSFTVEAFVYLNPGADNFQQILSNVDNGTSTGIYFSVGGASIAAVSSGYNGNGVASDGVVGVGSPLDTGTWIHVAWVGNYSAGNGTAVQFYVDGTAFGGLQFYAAGSGGSHINMGSNDWLIGGPSNNFNGYIDELRISNEALAPSQFLTAVPEPTIASSVVVGALATLLPLMRRNSRSRREA